MIARTKSGHACPALAWAAALVFLSSSSLAHAQSSVRPYALAVKSVNGTITLALRADHADLPAVAAELSKRLRLRVVVARSLEQETVTADFADTPLEAALMMVSARALIDYEIRRDAPPTAKAIYFLGPADPSPPADPDSPAPAGVMVEGNTEDPTDPAADLPLRVVGDAKAMSVSARKQRLSTVAIAVGEVIGAQVQLSQDGASDDVIDADLKDMPAEEVVQALSVSLRLIVRVDLGLGERVPIRLVVARPGRS